MAIFAAPIASWLLWKSFTSSIICLLATVLFMGSGLWGLDFWLTQQKAKQDAANQPPPPGHTVAPPPIVPIIRTPRPAAPASNPPKPRQDNSVHVGAGATIEQESKGDCSPNMIGGNSTVNCIEKRSAKVQIIQGEDKSEPDSVGGSVFCSDFKLSITGYSVPRMRVDISSPIPLVRLACAWTGNGSGSLYGEDRKSGTCFLVNVIGVQPFGVCTATRLFQKDLRVTVACDEVKCAID